jgi:hypothetical protein
LFIYLHYDELPKELKAIWLLKRSGESYQNCLCRIWMKHKRY